jgi:uncharacterized protein
MNPRQTGSGIFLSIAVILFVGPWSSAVSAGPDSGLAKGKRILEPFDYHGVTLDDGRLRMQLDEVRDYYLRIPNDDLLHGYRLRAGRPAPGVELGGWYTNDFGNVLPQIVSGLARMFAATGDPACRDKANALIYGWAECIAPDGYFFYSTHPTSRQYFYEKMVGALVDVNRYCGNKHALRFLDRITEYAVRTLNRAREYANAAGNPKDPKTDHAEWYTVAENLYRAYLATGDPKFRDFAEVWEYSEFWDLFAKGLDIHDPRPGGGRTDDYHAYSHVNSFASAGAAYLVKGDNHYLETLKNAYDYLQTNQLFATGGFGPNEGLVPHARVVESLGKTKRHFETQCGSWAAFKMSKYLISFTGDARYGDWVERLTLNGIGASLPMSTDGRVFYYADYSLTGAAKELHEDGWTCCTGTRPQAVADYDDLVFFKTPDSLCVNLFTPATARFEIQGVPVEVVQRTRFPESTEIRLTVSVPKPAKFAVKIRVPGWLAGAVSGTVNGNPAEIKIDARHWAVLERAWKSGDTLAVRLPARLWACRMDSSARCPAALMFGPVVLASRSSTGNPASRIDLDNLEKCLVPVEGSPLNFRLASDPDILVRPFYEFKQGERYFMYLDPGSTPVPAR